MRLLPFSSDIYFDPDEDALSTNFESGKPATLRDVRFEEACNRLAVEAVKRGCTDNVTVMIVDIIHPSKGEGTVTGGQFVVKDFS